MRKLRWIVLAGTLAAFAPAVPASAAPPNPSCPGQELSALAPELGADLGGFVSFEARNPGLEGRKSFGEELNEFAVADRQSCPEE
jgi:hypothetical protein